MADADFFQELLKEDVKPLRAYPFVYLITNIFPLVNRWGLLFSGTKVKIVFQIICSHGVLCRVSGSRMLSIHTLCLPLFFCTHCLRLCKVKKISTHRILVFPVCSLSCVSTILQNNVILQPITPNAFDDSSWKVYLKTIPSIQRFRSHTGACNAIVYGLDKETAGKLTPSQMKVNACLFSLCPRNIFCTFCLVVVHAKTHHIQAWCFLTWWWFVRNLGSKSQLPVFLVNCVFQWHQPTKRPDLTVRRKASANVLWWCCYCRLPWRLGLIQQDRPLENTRYLIRPAPITHRTLAM